MAALLLALSSGQIDEIAAAAGTGATFTISASVGGEVTSYSNWTWNGVDERFETTTDAQAAYLHFFDARLEGTTATIE